MIIAIDGPAASGKGTLAKRLATHYGLPHLDTGLLYRAVARLLLDDRRPLTDPAAAEEAALHLDASRLQDPRLRGAEMGEAASLVSGYQPVRDALLAFQRDFAAQATGAVLDGRDIGTVVCPLAEVKLFVMATPEEPLKAASDAVLLDTTSLDADAAFRAALEIVENRPRG
jgi:cytidylate kinase